MQAELVDLLVIVENLEAVVVLVVLVVMLEAVQEEVV